MATLFISVFDGAVETLIGRPVQQITVDITGSSVKSSAISGPSGKIRRVRLFADADCFVVWNDDPTAASGSAEPMGAENPEVFGIQAGDFIAVITR